MLLLINISQICVLEGHTFAKGNDLNFILFTYIICKVYQLLQ